MVSRMAGSEIDLKFEAGVESAAHFGLDGVGRPVAQQQYRRAAPAKHHDTILESTFDEFHKVLEHLIGRHPARSGDCREKPVDRYDDCAGRSIGGARFCQGVFGGGPGFQAGDRILKRVAVAVLLMPSASSRIPPKRLDRLSLHA